MTVRPEMMYESDWPIHPELVPTTRLGRTIKVGDSIEWFWRWRTCAGDYCTSDTKPGPVCHQPGVCVMHDPPGTVIPW